MKRSLLVLGVIALCLPMVMVTWLMLAVRWERMDPTTMKMPDEIRSMVASLVQNRPPYSPEKIDRVLRLDPQNPQALGTRCTDYTYDDKTPPQKKIAACQKAVSVNASTENLYALGRAQEELHQECEAEDSFSKAAERNTDSTDYDNVEGMGIAALRCGHLYDARSGLEQALDLQAKEMEDKQTYDAEEIANFKTDQADDREYLIVTYDRLHETKLAADTCKLAHPDWKACSCKLDEDGEPDCDAAKR